MKIYKLDENVSLQCYIEFTDEYETHFRAFIDHYSLENFHIHPDKKPKLSNKKFRKCRFCGKFYPEVKFNKEAHILPELIGNKNMISDSECNSCNTLFSNYEDSFANFLGITRAITHSKGKGGVPTFKNPDKKFTIRKNKELNKPNAIKIEIRSWDSEYLEVDESGKKFILKALKYPYKSIYVYKALLKIAISTLPENVLDKYDLCKQILLSDKYDKSLKDNPYFRLIGFFSPGTYFQTPKVFNWLKKKEKRNINIPSRTMSLFFQNFIFQIFNYVCSEVGLKYGKLIHLEESPPQASTMRAIMYWSNSRVNLRLAVLYSH